MREYLKAILVGTLGVLAAAHASAAVAQPTDIDAALEAEAEETAEAIRDMIVMGVSEGMRETIYIELGATVTKGELVSATSKGIEVKTRTATMALPWKRLSAKRLFLIGSEYIPADDAYFRLRLGRYCIAHGLLEDARKELGAISSLDDDLGAAAKTSLALIASLEAAKRPKPKAPRAREPKPKRPTVPVSGKTAELLTKLGRKHFMIGTSSATHDKWIPETKQQGCHWDMRYQYLAGGVNGDYPWWKWNMPKGQFVVNYINESERHGTVPVFTWYQTRGSEPGKSEGEVEGNTTNCRNIDTMREYLSSVKLFMEVVAKTGKPVILHVEPDLSGFYLVFNQFKPHDPNKIPVMVKSTGLDEVKDIPDTLVGFYRAFAKLRDMYAPNVILAWHASMWMDPPPIKRIADTINASGGWDLVFVDPSDRDSAWKLANGYHVNGAWWSDKDFDNWRNWCGQLHQQTGLPMIAWQIPMGNTIMAACNNTPGHYMDNRPQYWLEGYPKNTHILEWASAGFVGLLFGRGAGGNTANDDAEKDGVTNPEPIEGNKGEKSTWPDDDGGYLRIRGSNYFASPVLFSFRK